MRYLDTILKFKFAIILVILFLTVSIAWTQTKSELEEKRIALNQTIEDLNSKLSNAKADKASLISQYNTLEAQIDSRQELIKTIQEEIKLVSQEIETKEIKRDTIDATLNNLINDYAVLLNIDYIERLKNPNNYLLLTSGNLIDAFTRWRHLKQFELYLSSRLKKIESLNAKVNAQEEEILNDKLHKETLLEKEQQNLELLKQEMTQIDQALKEKSSEQSNIKTELKHYNTSREKLNKEIEALYFNSISSSSYNTPSSSNSKTIEQRKGFMQWPLSQKKIELRYGEQYHPVHKNIKINNSGVDISSPYKEVSAITNGRVVSVTKISNMETTIIIQHDNDYYTVYSNLKTPYVNPNDLVSSNQVIGELNLIKNKYQLHFEIWKGKRNLNPTNWLQNN